MDVMGVKITITLVSMEEMKELLGLKRDEVKPEKWILPVDFAKWLLSMVKDFEVGFWCFESFGWRILIFRFFFFFQH